MPKTEAGQAWREKNTRLTLDIKAETKTQWDEYAKRLNMPTGRMVRMCVERCIMADRFGPASSDVQNGTEQDTNDNTSI